MATRVIDVSTNGVFSQQLMQFYYAVKKNVYNQQKKLSFVHIYYLFITQIGHKY